MPGSTPYEAFQAFIEPLQAAISCLGHAKINVSRGGKNVLDTDHSWTLNELGGMALGDSLFFKASMRYQIVGDADRTFRVTTKSYMYSLLQQGEEKWAMHWHPDGQSDYTEPHLHIPSVAGKGHLRAPRMTFEEAVLWAIQSGATPARADWMEVLEASYTLHVQFRSWHDHTGTVPRRST